MIRNTVQAVGMLPISSSSEGDRVERGSGSRSFDIAETAGGNVGTMTKRGLELEVAAAQVKAQATLSRIAVDDSNRQSGSKRRASTWRKHVRSFKLSGGACNLRSGVAQRRNRCQGFFSPNASSLAGAPLPSKLSRSSPFTARLQWPRRRSPISRRASPLSSTKCR